MRQPKIKLDRDGVPVDAMDWTKSDWHDLWLGIRRIKKMISRRYVATTSKPKIVNPGGKA